jgi:plasmid stabilization system protein ParE
MAHAIWSPAAEADLAGVYEWIVHRDGRRAAARAIVREVKEKCERYGSVFAAGSVIGESRPDLGESCRIFTHKRWVVVFRPARNGIDVVRIFDGSHDYAHEAD